MNENQERIQMLWKYTASELNFAQEACRDRNLRELREELKICETWLNCIEDHEKKIFRKKLEAAK